MTLCERADAFAAAFPTRGASHLSAVSEGGHVVLYGRWCIGQDYRNRSRYYGAYPAGYLKRVMALFPEFVAPRFPGHVLHLFSGSLPASDQYERCDSVQPAELQCSAYDLPRVVLNYRPRLILADPPYSSADAKRYGTRGIDRGRVFRALAEITDPGAFVVWLDTCWPMHSKRQWQTVGRIALTRSTNHRTRDISIFERVA